MLANARTGLAAPVVLYFGNLVGETGDALSPLRVSAADLGGVKAALNSAAGISSRFDFNRDGKVNTADLGLLRSNIGASLPFITAPTTSTASAAPVTALGPPATPAEQRSRTMLRSDLLFSSAPIL